MDCYLLQDWLSLRTTSGGTITQSEQAWLDLGAYRDVIAWIDVREMSPAGVPLAIQTSVAKEESLFATMVALLPSSSSGLTVLPALQDVQTGAVNAAGLARWVRWQVSSMSAWDITFRIWIAANKPGRAAMKRAATSPR